MMLVVRPVAVMLSTLWSGLHWKESLLISFIAPRGVVAVAVAGLFAAELTAIGRPEGELFVPLAFGRRRWRSDCWGKPLVLRLGKGAQGNGC